MHSRTAFLSVLMCMLATMADAQNKRDIAVREDKQKLASDESWLYDDLESGLAVAASTKRPLMIVFR